MSDNRDYTDSNAPEPLYEPGEGYSVNEFGEQVQYDPHEGIYEEIPPEAEQHMDEAYQETEEPAPRKSNSKLKAVLFIGAFAVMGGGFMVFMLGSGGSPAPAPVANIGTPVNQPPPGNAVRPQSISSSVADQSEVDRLAALMEGAEASRDTSNRAHTEPLTDDSPTSKEGVLSVGAGSVQEMVSDMVSQMDSMGSRVNSLESQQQTVQVSLARVENEQRETRALIGKLQEEISSFVNLPSKRGGQTPKEASQNDSSDTEVSRYHTVSRGETLLRLSEHYKIPLDQLIALNGIQNPSFIPVGMKIRVDGQPVSDADKARNQSMTSGSLARSNSRNSKTSSSARKSSGWFVAGMSPGRVVVVSPDGRYLSGAVGETLPEVGRINAINITQQTVVTSSGTLKMK